MLESFMTGFEKRAGLLNSAVRVMSTSDGLKRMGTHALGGAAAGAIGGAVSDGSVSGAFKGALGGAVAGGSLGLGQGVAQRQTAAAALQRRTGSAQVRAQVKAVRAPLAQAGIKQVDRNAVGRAMAGTAAPKS